MDYGFRLALRTYPLYVMFGTYPAAPRHGLVKQTDAKYHSAYVRAETEALARVEKSSS